MLNSLCLQNLKGSILYLLFIFQLTSATIDSFVDPKILHLINLSMDQVFSLDKDLRDTEFKKINIHRLVVPIRTTFVSSTFLLKGEPNLILKRTVSSKKSLEDMICNEMKSSEHVVNLITSHREYQTKLLTGEYVQSVSEGVFDRIVTWMVFEYLDIKLSLKGVNLNENIIRNVMRDSLLGLAYMHSKDFAHLDIKLGNIMGLKTKSGIVYKLIDLGSSVYINPQEGFHIHKSAVGTFSHKSPEVELRMKHTLASDIFSLGMTCWYLSQGVNPFYTSNRDQDRKVYTEFIKSLYDKQITITFVDQTSPALRDFITMALDPDYLTRPTALELLNHSFIRNQNTNWETLKYANN